MAPSVTTVVLQSPGGWIRQGQMVADVIRARGLNTYAEGVCASACTIAFLAGKDRSVAPRAKLGFHSGRNVGGEGVADVSAIYRSAGLPERMIRKIANTSFDDMWFPLHEELLAAGVITRQSVGGEGAALATAIQTQESLTAQLKTINAFAALSERFPDEFERVRDAAWARIQQGASDAEVVTATRRQVASMAPRLVPYGSDATLLAFLDLSIEQLQALQARNQDACSEFAFPSGRPIDFSMLMPKNLAERELDLLTSLIREFDPSRKPTSDPNRFERLMEQVHSQMTEVQLDALDRLQRGLTQQPGQLCAAAIALYDSIRHLAQKDRVWVLRTLLATT